MLYESLEGGFFVTVDSAHVCDYNSLWSQAHAVEDPCLNSDLLGALISNRFIEGVQDGGEGHVERET